MRKLIIYSLALTILLTVPVSAYAWTHCGTSQAESDCPKGTPYVTTSPTPTTQATSTPSASPDQTATPSGTGVPTSNDSTNRRTDLSDGKSDGHTESLGCLRPEDHCYSPRVAGASIELPSTGGALDFGMTIICLAIFLSGVYMVRSANKQEGR